MLASSATGTPITIVGWAKSNVKLGNEEYPHTFLVCRNIKRKMILGLDFLHKFKIGTSWSGAGNFQITTPSQETIEAIQVIKEKPVLRTSTKITIPARTLGMIIAEVKVQEKHSNKYYEVEPNLRMMEEHPNLAMIPLYHFVDGEGVKQVPICLVNLDNKQIILSKDKIVGVLKRRRTKKVWKADEVVKILVEEVDMPGGPEDYDLVIESQQNDKEDDKVEGKFIVSPADIQTKKKPELKDAEIGDEWREAFNQMTSRYEAIFSKDSADIGKTPLVQMEIDTGDHPPISQRPYTLALKHVEWVRQELETLEKAKIITRSISPWASPIVIVPKKSAPDEPPKKRMCVDYRALNSLLPPVTKAFSKAKGVLAFVPLPKIDEIYASLQGSTIYSTFDMRSGYYHIELTEESKAKSAFVVGGAHSGKWQFNRCPFGLTQAPAYFQRVVGEVIQGLSFAIGYLDDILVFSANPKEHIDHCEQIFQRLEKYQLKLSYEKCALMKAQVQYLGHLLSGSGIEPVPEKLEALKAMVRPVNPKGIKQYLGFVGYYRKFIPKYSDIAKPLTELTKFDVAFNWSDECQKAYDLLKEYLLKEPILRYPDPELPYILYTDASKYAWAGVLTQSYTHFIEEKEREVHHPITYLSGLFKGSQMNWATLTKEAYAIYMSVKKLHVYLDGGDNTIRSDHLPLKKFLTRDTANNKVRNWAVDLEGYRLKFEYIKGIKNTLADAMSRLVDILPDAELLPEPEGFEFGELVVNEVDVISLESRLVIDEVDVVILDEVDVEKLTEGWPEVKKTEETEPIEETKIRWYMTDPEIVKLQRQDTFCQKLLSEIQNRKRKSRDCYFMSRGLLHKYVTDYKQRFEALVVPITLSKLILKLAHDELGHNGTARTYAMVKRMFYWKGLKKDVERYIKSCPTCQEYTVNAVRYTPGQFEIPEAPMDFISMDLIGEFRMGSIKGNRFALTVICMLTGYTWCIPIPDKSAKTVVYAYLKEVYNNFGGSRKILSDNGTEFKNQLFKAVSQELEIDYKVYSPPYHPPSNGRIEGFHSFLKACLSKHIKDPMEWDEIVPFVCSVYNALPNEHSREAPFFLMFGRDPRLPLNDFLRPKLRYLGNDEVIISLEAMKKIYKLAAQNLKLARERMNKKKQQTKPTKLETGALIMIKRHDKKMFEPRYEGYYRIVKIRGNQLDIMPIEGGPQKTIHIKHAKPIIPVDRVMQSLPDYTNYGRKSRYNINVDELPDLNWSLSTIVNTFTTPTTTISDIVSGSSTTTTTSSMNNIMSS